MKQKILLQSYTVRLVIISLMAFFMAAEVAADPPKRHKRPQPAANQQSTGKTPVTGKLSILARARSEKHVTRKTTVSGHRDVRVDRERGRRVVNHKGTIQYTTNHRLAEKKRMSARERGEKRVTRKAIVSDRRDNRGDWERGRRVADHRDTFRSGDRPGFLSVSGHRNYPYNHRHIRHHRYIPFTYRGHHYFYNGGDYYRYTGIGFSLVDDDIGVFLYSLPFGFRTLMIGDYPYYYVNRHYYIWDHVRDVYIQVDDPYQAADADDSDNQSAAPPKLIVYPKNGQTEEQMKKDEYECYLWAVDQTGFDPGLGKPGDIQDHLRAKSACLEGRGYVVN